MTEETINALCEKFHTTVNNLIPVYAKYAMAKDIANGLICLLFMAICIGILIYLRYRAKKNKYTDYWLDASAAELIFQICAAVAAVVLFVVICINIYDYMMWLYSPSMRFLDYVAI